MQIVIKRIIPLKYRRNFYATVIIYGFKRLRRVMDCLVLDTHKITQLYPISDLVNLA